MCIVLRIWDSMLSNILVVLNWGSAYQPSLSSHKVVWHNITSGTAAVPFVLYVSSHHCIYFGCNEIWNKSLVFFAPDRLSTVRVGVVYPICTNIVLMPTSISGDLNWCLIQQHLSPPQALPIFAHYHQKVVPSSSWVQLSSILSSSL